ncbi:MAG: hypothetical protein ACK40X_00570 [Armatimonadota bacterium]
MRIIFVAKLRIQDLFISRNDQASGTTEARGTLGQTVKRNKMQLPALEHGAVASLHRTGGDDDGNRTSEAHYS